MSQKSKKSGKRKSARKEQEVKKVVLKEIRPVASIPRPEIVSRHMGTSIERAGRGYSMGEIAGANLGSRLAVSWGVPIDLRRRSTLERNVKALANWYGGGPKAPVASPTVEVEEEVQEPVKKPAKSKAGPKKTTKSSRKAATKKKK